MTCAEKPDINPIATINRWTSAINLIASRLNPLAGVFTGQFTISTQAGASAVALANGDGSAATAIPGVSISAPTLAWFAKVGGWISVIARTAGVAVPGVGAVALGMTLVSVAAAAASNETFSDIATDPAFWGSLGNGSPDEYLQSTYGVTMSDLLDGLIDALLTGEMRSLGCSIEDIKRKTQSASTIRSPIVLDLDGNGVQTVSLAEGVFFDHGGDGFAERSGWVAPGDGLLVWDRDANARIDSGRELFGAETLLPDGTRAVNGFEALRALDANADGVIDASDPVFAQLRVWVDASADGRTGEGELLTLQEAGVRSINLAYANSTHVDAQGNAHRRVGSYTTSEGEVRSATDVWVQTNPTQSLPKTRCVSQMTANRSQCRSRLCLRPSASSPHRHRTCDSGPRRHRNTSGDRKGLLPWQ